MLCTSTLYKHGNTNHTHVHTWEYKPHTCIYMIVLLMMHEINNIHSEWTYTIYKHNGTNTFIYYYNYLYTLTEKINNLLAAE